MSASVVTLHGAARTVTGSCYELELAGARILVDCGLFQGSRSLERLNFEPFAFDPRRIDGVLLTHAHLDHCGLLPKLFAKGFRGTIWCSPATADLLPVMLADAAKIQEGDAERRNRRPDRADEPRIEPLYTVEDAAQAAALALPTKLAEDFEPAPGVRARLWNAGHILGSASIEIEAGGVRMLFSGDVGPANKSFELDPAGPRSIDHLFCESTYGDRARETLTQDERRSRLGIEVKAALARGGNLVIPVFALERTQELLLDLARLMNRGELARTPVFIDSPLAQRATAVFDRHRAELEDLGSGEVFRHPAFHFVGSVDKVNSPQLPHRSNHPVRIGNVRRRPHPPPPAPQPATRRLDRAVRRLSGAGNVGTYHRRRGPPRQDLRARRAVRASIRRIDSYSAHADRSELKAWALARRPVAGSLFLTHGEEQASETLRQDLDRDFASIVVPEIGERFELPSGEPARRLRTGRVELREAVGADWQNDYADFAANLKRELQRIDDAAARREALGQMRRVLDSYAEHRLKHRTAAR